MAEPRATRSRVVRTGGSVTAGTEAEAAGVGGPALRASTSDAAPQPAADLTT